MEMRVLKPVVAGIIVVILMGCSSIRLSKKEGENVKEWMIPAGGNAFVVKAPAGDARVESDGISGWRSGRAVVRFFVKVHQGADLKLSLKLRVPGGESVISLRAGEKHFQKRISGVEMHLVDFGEMVMERPGYLMVELQGLSKTGECFAEVAGLLIKSGTCDLTLSYVMDNDSNRFYWGRRGPSVHLNYKIPEQTDVRYFYNELTVPRGKDPVGSFFMANGFGEGYFGMQVNGVDERRVLFSVWSPYKTDNPSQIPEEKRIVLLRKGEGVSVGEFGNEGSGGQSFLKYTWKAGVTYRFLNAAEPDGKGNTIYTAWFYAPEEDGWRLIASFKRPQTDTYLTHLHSFLENFIDANGWEERQLIMGNQWIYTSANQWVCLDKGVFTGDDIARRNYRQDYAGGNQGDHFFLQNGGFFDQEVKLRTSFQREDIGWEHPQIDFRQLQKICN